MAAVAAYGIDGSHFQKLSNAKSVKDGGIEFGWWKGTEGTSLVDPTFASCAAALKAAGIITGGYHYAHAGSASTQAAFFRRIVAAYLTPGNLWPMLDMEDASLQAALAAAHLDSLDLAVTDDVNVQRDRLASAMWTTRDHVDASRHVWPTASRGQRLLLKDTVRELAPVRVPADQLDVYRRLAELAARSANVFICAFYDALGTGCMVNYGNLTWWQTIFRPATWGSRRIVGNIARYNGDPGSPGFLVPVIGVHQHSDARTLDGISACDGDAICNGYTLAGITIPTGQPKPPEAPMTDPGKLTDKDTGGGTRWHDILNLFQQFTAGGQNQVPVITTGISAIKTELDALPDELKAELDAALAGAGTSGTPSGTYPVTLALGGSTVATGTLVVGPKQAAAASVAQEGDVG